MAARRRSGMTTKETKVGGVDTLTLFGVDTRFSSKSTHTQSGHFTAKMKNAGSN